MECTLNFSGSSSVFEKSIKNVVVGSSFKKHFISSFLGSKKLCV